MQNAWEVLCILIKGAKKVVAMDAFLCPESVSVFHALRPGEPKNTTTPAQTPFFVQTARQPQSMKAILFINTRRNDPNTYLCYDRLDDWQPQLKRCLDDKKCATFVTNSVADLRWVLEMAKTMLQDELERVEGLSSMSSDDMIAKALKDGNRLISSLSFFGTTPVLRH